MDKSFARNIVLADWAGKENMMKNCGKTMVHDSQREKAVEICGAFIGGLSLVTFVAPMQWGKTGVAMSVMYMMTTHTDDKVMIHPDNVFILSGMSDTDWRQQTKGRMLSCFRDRVYHRNDMHKIISEIANKKDALLVVDECHFGSENNQTLHTCLKSAGILDIDYMTENNIKILCISATPGNVLLDALTWGPQHHLCVVAKDNGDKYTGFDTLLEENRVQPIVDIKKEKRVQELLDTIEERWDTPRYHIIRATDAALKNGVFLKAVLDRGYNVSRHNSNDRIYDIEKLLLTEPSEHHFIHIKGLWRAAKTLDDTYIGVCLEGTRDYTAVAQGLGGRLLGYNRQRGATAPLLYCDVNAVKEYDNWLNNNANYLMCKKYNSAALKITKGDIKHKKESTIHSTNIENLTEVEIQHKSEELCDEIKKVGTDPVYEVPANARLATKLDTYSVEQFMEVFGLDEFSTDTDKLRALMLNANHSVNISLKKNSASAVSNLVNYYKKPHWAQGEYHVIKLEDDEKVIVITRIHSVLKNLKHGDFVVAHNSKEQMILYRKV